MSTSQSGFLGNLFFAILFLALSLYLTIFDPSPATASEPSDSRAPQTLEIEVPVKAPTSASEDFKQLLEHHKSPAKPGQDKILEKAKTLHGLGLSFEALELLHSIPESTARNTQLLESGFSVTQEKLIIHLSNGETIHLRDVVNQKSSQKVERIKLYRVLLDLLESSRFPSSQELKLLDQYSWDYPPASLALFDYYQRSENAHLGRAAFYLNRSADQGHLDSWCKLGDYYLHGKGVIQDYGRAAISYASSHYLSVHGNKTCLKKAKRLLMTADANGSRFYKMKLKERIYRSSLYKLFENWNKQNSTLLGVRGYEDLPMYELLKND